MYFNEMLMREEVEVRIRICFQTGCMYVVSMQMGAKENTVERMQWQL